MLIVFHKRVIYGIFDNLIYNKIKFFYYQNKLSKFSSNFHPEMERFLCPKCLFVLLLQFYDQQQYVCAQQIYARAPEL